MSDENTNNGTLTTETTPATDKAADTTSTVETANATDQTADTTKTAEQPTTETKTEEVKPKAPESYADFEMADGMVADEALKARAIPLFKELDLTQEQAQKLVDFQAQMLKEQNENWIRTSQQWAESVKSDSEIGGTFFDQNVATARKAVQTFGTPELQNLLNEYQIGNHPEFVRFAYRVGKAMGEGKVITGNSGASSEKSAAEVLYGGS